MNSLEEILAAIEEMSRPDNGLAQDRIDALEDIADKAYEMQQKIRKSEKTI
jgi:hypothetical protein